MSPEQKRWFVAGYRLGRAHSAKHVHWLARHLEDEVAIVNDAEPVESEEPHPKRTRVGPSLPERRTTHRPTSPANHDR
jgi:hypothetical protein